jgi:hypothetical protein
MTKFVLAGKDIKMTGEDKHQQKRHSNAIVNSEVKDYGSEPFFVKKANDSKRFLEKHGFPKAFRRKSGNA